jgi:predicted nucleic-acid-binding Zn-ribbon protein
MRLIEVLPDYEIKRWSRTPILSNEDRKHYFRLDDIVTELIKRVKDPNNKVGLLLSYGYFKASGKFYNQKDFKLTDVRIAAKILGVSVSKYFSEQYSDRTRQKHRLLILNQCGYTEFSKAEIAFENFVEDFVASQMHPRRLFYVLVETLRNKKIELPSYDRIARSITTKFSAFEKTALQAIAKTINPTQEDTLDQLTKTNGEDYQRPLLTRLKIDYAINAANAN